MFHGLRRVSRLLGLALVSWTFARVRVHCLSFRLPYLGVFLIHSSSSGIGFHSSIFHSGGICTLLLYTGLGLAQGHSGPNCVLCVNPTFDNWINGTHNVYSTSKLLNISFYTFNYCNYCKKNWNTQNLEHSKSDKSFKSKNRLTLAYHWSWKGAVHKVRHDLGGGVREGVTVCDRKRVQEHETSHFTNLFHTVTKSNFESDV